MAISSKKEKSFCLSSLISRLFRCLVDPLLHLWQAGFRFLPRRWAESRTFRAAAAGVTYLAVAAVFIVLGRFVSYKILDEIFLCFGVALLGIGIAFILVRKFNRNWIRNLAFFVIFILGIISYMQIHQVNMAEVKHKTEVITRGIEVTRPDRNDALDVLAKVGGLEIGGIAGVILDDAGGVGARTGDLSAGRGRFSGRSCACFCRAEDPTRMSENQNGFHDHARPRSGGEFRRPGAAAEKRPPKTPGPHASWTALLAGCKALACFFPSRGGYDTVDKSVTDYAEPLYVIFQILVYVFFIYVALMIWGERIFNRIINFWTLDKNKYVIWCKSINDNMNYLVEDIRKKDCWARIVFSVSEAENQDKVSWLFREANYCGCVLKLRKPLQIHSDCLKAHRHFFLTEDFNWNIREARRFLAKRKENSISLPVELFIMIGDSSENIYYQMWVDQIHAEAEIAEQQSGMVEIHLISESELIARKFIKEYPMLKCPGIVIDPETATVKGNFRTLLLGLGNHGREILRSIIEDGQFVHKRDPDCPDTDFFKIDIIDKNPNRLSWFFNSFPDANRYCKMDLDHLEKYQIDVFSGEFLQFLSEKLAVYNRIVICLGDDDLNLQAAACIEHAAKKQMVSLEGKLFTVLLKSHVLINDVKETLMPDDHRKAYCNKIVECLENSRANHLLNLVAIGNPAEIFTYDNVAGEDDVTRTGKLIQLAYVLKDKFDLNKILGSSKPLLWLATEQVACAYYGLEHTVPSGTVKEVGIVSSFNRQSSLSSARGYRNIVLLLDPSLTAAQAECAIPPEVHGKLLETLAETEHLRWCAFHFMRGISTWNPEKPPEGAKPNDIFRNLRHAALVDYAELDRINERFSLTGEKRMQYNDLKIVENIRLVRLSASNTASDQVTEKVQKL